MVIQQGARAIDAARYTTLAGQILQSQMEKIRMLTWTQLTDTTHGPVAFNSFTTDVAPSANAQISRFTFTQSITAPSGTFNAQIRDIVLTATWKGIEGQNHSVSYRSRYLNNGISSFFYTSR